MTHWGSKRQQEQKSVGDVTSGVGMLGRGAQRHVEWRGPSVGVNTPRGLSLAPYDLRFQPVTAPTIGRETQVGNQFFYDG